MKGFDYLTEKKLSIKIPIVIICLLLIIWYMFSLAEFLVRPPSVDFSNPIFIGSVDYGAIKNMKTAVISSHSQDDKLYITAIDGNRTRCFIVNSEGKVVQQLVVALNMYAVRHVAMDITSDGDIHLFYLDKDLHEALIDINNSSFQEQLIQTDVKDFDVVPNGLVLRNEDSLVLWNQAANKLTTTDQNEKIFNSVNAYQKNILVTDTITSYQVGATEDTVCILYMNKEGELKSVLYSTKDEHLSISKIESDVELKYLRTIEDALIKDDQVIGIYAHVNKQFGVNTITAIRYQIETEGMDTLLSEVENFQQEFSIQKGAIDAITFDKDQIVVVLQDDINYGVNLVRVLFRTNETPRIESLTKTKYYSVAANYFDASDTKELVFSDRPGDEREIYYASSHPDIIKSTSKLKDVDLIQLCIVTVLVTGMSVLPSIATYLLKTALFPMLLLILGERILRKRNFIANVSGSLLLVMSGIAQYLLSVVLSTDLQKEWSGLAVMPIGIISLSTQLVVLGVISLLVLVICFYMYRRDCHFEKSPLIAFGIYLTTVYFAYLMLIVAYIYTELIISKV